MTLRFGAEFAHLARQGYAAWDSLQDEPDGAVLVTLNVPDAHWGASTAMAYGPAVTVLEPAEIAALVREWALATARQYD